MIIGSIKEQNADETRVALVPSVVKKLTAGRFHRIARKRIRAKSRIYRQGIYFR